MKEELISIIVAAYNTEDYIEECIESVLKQVYSNWEMIIVNDGSTDKSGDICEYYSQLDKRIKVIHQSNGGQSKARNVALKHSQGKYLIFLDSDDKLALDSIGKLYQSIKKSSADICCAGIRLFGNNREKYLYVSSEETVVDSREACRRMFTQEGLDSNTFAKIYKRELWDGIEFPEGTIFEDVPIMYKVILKCKKVILGDFCVYEQRSRNGSTTRVHFSEKRIIYTQYSQKVYEDIFKNYPELSEEAFVYYLTAVLDNYIHVCCSPHNGAFEQYRKQLLRVIKENRRLINKYYCLSRFKSRILVSYIGVGRILYPIYQRIR